MEEDPPFAEVPSPTRADIHPTDVLMRFSQARGAQWFSVVEVKPGHGMILVQNQDGVQTWVMVSSFMMRYSLKDSGRFGLTWRVSPINAVASNKKGP